MNTDVVVLWIATFHDLSIGEIWIALGVKKYYRYIAVHTIAKQNMGEKIPERLPSSMLSLDVIPHVFYQCCEENSLGYMEGILRDY